MCFYITGTVHMLFFSALPYYAITLSMGLQVPHGKSNPGAFVFYKQTQAELENFKEVFSWTLQCPFLPVTQSYKMLNNKNPILNDSCR